VRDRCKIPKPTYTKLGSKQSIGNVTSGLERPLAAEIVFLPFSAIRKALSASKRHKIDGKCQQNSNRKPWSLYRLVTTFPVSNAPSGRNLHSAIIDIQNVVKTFKRCILHTFYILNTNRKSRSTNRLVTSFSVCDVI
jgi:hypothetical protein